MAAATPDKSQQSKSVNCSAYSTPLGQDDFGLSPPDNNDGGMIFRMTSLLKHRCYGSNDNLELSSTPSKDSNEGFFRQSPLFNKWLSLESSPLQMKKGSSMVTIPESASLVTTMDNDIIASPNMLSPPESTTPSFLTRAASTGQIAAMGSEKSKTPKNKQIFRTVPNTTSPRVTARDLNQLAPLHF